MLERQHHSAQAQRALLRQFGRFLIVGLANTALSVAAYRLFLDAGMPYLVAALAAFAVGAINGYRWNRRWTFAARDTTRARMLYVVVQATGAVTTSLLVCSSFRSPGRARPSHTWQPFHR
jgi:putative flippase GtrA